MAMELRSETPQFTSPRISFSHDLSQSDINEQRLLPSSLSSSTVDFDFNVRFDHQSSSAADDLFSGGVILPIDPKLNLKPPPPPSPPPSPRPPLPLDHIGEISTCKSECAVSISSESLDQKQKSTKSSFWQFKRSNSFNCSNGYARTLCPIPLLSRSSSTGSASSSKKLSSSSPRECHPNYKHKNPVLSASTKQSQFPSSNSCQKPPLKRNCYGSSNGNGVRVNAVLNVPSANLFGLGSIFSGKKEKNKKK